MAIKSSSSPNLDFRSRGGTEAKKKVKKLRSMKLSKMPSLKSSARRVKTQFDHAPVDSFSDDESSESSQIEFSSTSPNCMKATSCSDAKKEGNESDWASVGSSSYGSMPSTPSSLNGDRGMRKGTDLRKTLKKSRSIRLGILGSSRPTSSRAKSRFDQPHSGMSSDASPNYLKATSCSEGKKMHFQASLHDSESSFGSIDDNRRNSHESNSGSSSLKSMQTFRRTSSMRRLTIFINKSSFKSKKSSVNKCNQVSQDSGVNRATCSSTLKDSKFPRHGEPHPGEGKSERTSVMKVCPYNYCSLHGHHHSPTPPLKRLLSKRRRFLKTQKSMKLRRQSSKRSKYPDDIMKEIETSQMVINGDPELRAKANASAAIFPVGKEESSDLSVQIYTKPRMEFVTRPNKGNEDASLNQEENFGPAKDEKNGDLAIDVDTVGQFAPVGDSEPDSTAREVYKSRLHKKKHISMWHLIHQHMVSGLDAEAGTQMLDGANEEKQVDDTNRLPAPQSSGCSPGLSDSYQNMGTQNHDTDSQEVELRKIYAVKMVREAIEKILLPEVQDQSSDDRSISSDITSEQELLETTCGEGGELKIPNLTADKISGPEQEVTASTEGGKTEKRTPKSWSNLKKWILLQRFIKQLEKVRKFNPRMPQNLSLEPDPEVEKVSLRRQRIDRKKSSEEWMLDYALQQVVSELAPTQKRKVELLIKAFETVVPPSDEQQIQLTFPKLKGIRNEGCCTESELDQYESPATHKDKKVEDIVTSNPDNGDENSITADRQANVPVDRIPNFNLEHPKNDSASSEQTMEVDGLCSVTGQPLHITKSQTTDGNGESTVTDNIASSASDYGSFKQLTVVGEVKYGDSNSWEHAHFDKSHSPADPLKTDDIVSTCSEAVQNMNSDFFKEDGPSSNSEKLEIGNSTGGTHGLPSITKRPTSDDLAEAAVDNSVISSTYVCGPLEKLTTAREQNNGDSEPDTEPVEGFGLVRDSEPDNSSYKAYKTKVDKGKHVSMWHLIHQQMVAGLAVEGETKQLDKDNEEHVGEANTLDATESSGSCPGSCDSFQNIGMEYHDTDSQEVEIRKIFAIKLVREAIEKILLPEVQDQSSDDQSITSEITSDQEQIEKNNGESGDPSISTSTDSAKASSMECKSNKVTDDISLSQEETRVATAKISESENENTASKVENKSDKKTPKGWSNLKKMILLNRFIKELEKVRKFNPQKPRHLPLKPGPEAEEVRLRHQTTDERKSTEEWMLDYALRKVVSELAPKQKRKVALLVKAFETVAPSSEEPQIQVTSPKLKGTNRECCCNESEHDNFVSKATEADVKAKDIITSNHDNGDSNPTITDKKSDVAVDEEDQEEVHKETVSSFHLEFLKDGSVSTGKNVELDALSGVNVEPTYVIRSAAPDTSREATAANNIASSASDCDRMEQLIVAKKKMNRCSETDCTAEVGNKTQLDKQKYISMWQLLCQHVVSGIDTKVETQLVDGEDEDEQVDGAKTLPQIRTGSFRDNTADHDRGKEDRDSISQKIGFSQSDAVKLVQEAIEEILLPEIQDDSSDAQSIASDFIPEQELLEKNHRDVGEPSFLNSMDSPKDSFREHNRSEAEGHNILDQEEKGSAAHNIPTPDEQRAVPMVGNKSEQQKPRNWNKVKKLILLKRSIKALEKARKSNPGAPWQLPLEPGPEEEKVDLKRQSKDERKKTEEWMKDYALQHMVTKLTPARKRRVLMLVEAFESVVPLPEI